MTIMPCACCQKVYPHYWPGKASEKTPKGVFLPVCVKYHRTAQEKEKFIISERAEINAFAIVLTAAATEAVVVVSSVYDSRPNSSSSSRQG
jgi:hypothetical protein